MRLARLLVSPLLFVGRGQLKFRVSIYVRGLLLTQVTHCGMLRFLLHVVWSAFPLGVLPAVGCPHQWAAHNALRTKVWEIPSMVGCFSFISRLVLHHLELLLRWRTLHTPGAALSPETAAALNRSDGLDVAPANP